MKTSVDFHKSAPPWFRQLPPKPGRFIGYGQGKSAEDAKAKALAELSEMIEVKVESKFAGKTTVINEEVYRSASKSIQVTSKHRLKNVKLLREFQRTDGYFFVAHELDLRPTEQILAEQLISTWNGALPGKIIWHGSPWIVSSEFMREIEQRIINDNGSEVKIYVSLQRKHENWLLSVGDVNQILDPADLRRIIRWESTRPDAFSLGLKPMGEVQTRNRLKAGDYFALLIKSTKAKGYFTIINIYTDGKINLIQDSQPLGLTQEFPTIADQKSGFILEAAVMEPDKIDQNLYLALWTEAPLDTTNFQLIREDRILKGEQSYKLHQLLKWLENQDILAIGVLKVEVQP